MQPRRSPPRCRGQALGALRECSLAWVAAFLAPLALAHCGSANDRHAQDIATGDGDSHDPGTPPFSLAVATPSLLGVVGEPVSLLVRDERMDFAVPITFELTADSVVTPGSTLTFPVASEAAIAYVGTTMYLQHPLTFAAPGVYVVTVTAHRAAETASSTVLVSVFAPDARAIIGDVDGSSVWDEADADLVAAYLAGDRPLTDAELLAADVDLDERVTAADLALLRTGNKSWRAPWGLVPQTAARGASLLVVDPLLLDPSLGAAAWILDQRTGAEVSVPLLRIAPGYARVLVPMTFDTPQTTTLRVAQIVDFQETYTSSYDLTLTAPRAPSGAPGALLREALTGIVTTVDSVDGNLGEVAAAQGIPSGDFRAFVAPGVELVHEQVAEALAAVDALAAESPADLARLEEVASANGLADFVDALRAAHLSRGPLASPSGFVIPTAPSESRGYLDALCFSRDAARLADQFGKYAARLNDLLYYADLLELVGGPASIATIESLHRALQAAKLGTDIVKLIGAFVPKPDDVIDAHIVSAAHVNQAFVNLAPDTSLTLQATIRLRGLTQLCFGISGGSATDREGVTLTSKRGAAWLNDKIKLAILQTIVGSVGLPFMQGFRDALAAAEWDPDKIHSQPWYRPLGATLKRIIDEVYARTFETTVSQAVQRLCDAMTNGIQAATGGDFDPELPLPPGTVLAPSCGHLDGDTFTCKSECFDTGITLDTVTGQAVACQLSDEDGKALSDDALTLPLRNPVSFACALCDASCHGCCEADPDGGHLCRATPDADNRCGTGGETCHACTGGITVTPDALTLAEAGVGAPESGDIQVTLAARPGADVRLPVHIDLDHVRIAPDALVFTPANWNVPQRVHVAALGTSGNDGDRWGFVDVGPAESSDTGFAGVGPASVSVSIGDSDRISVTPTGLTLTEGGATGTFTVALVGTPSAPVTIAVASTDPSEASVTPTGATLGGDGPTSQVFTVQAVPDGVYDTRGVVMVTAPATSADPLFAGVDPPDVFVVTTDASDNTCDACHARRPWADCIGCGTTMTCAFDTSWRCDGDHAVPIYPTGGDPCPLGESQILCHSLDPGPGASVKPYCVPTGQVTQWRCCGLALAHETEACCGDQPNHTDGMMGAHAYPGDSPLVCAPTTLPGGASVCRTCDDGTRDCVPDPHVACRSVTTSPHAGFAQYQTVGYDVAEYYDCTPEACPYRTNDVLADPHTGQAYVNAIKASWYLADPGFACADGFHLRLGSLVARSAADLADAASCRVIVGDFTVSGDAGEHLFMPAPGVILGSIHIDGSGVRSIERLEPMLGAVAGPAPVYNFTGDVVVTNNSALASLALTFRIAPGYPYYRTLPRDVIVRGNAALTTLDMRYDGTEYQIGGVAVTRDLIIEENPMLASVAAFRTLGTFRFAHNDRATFVWLPPDAARIEVIGNAALASLPGFRDLFDPLGGPRCAPKPIVIEDNPGLTDCYVASLRAAVQDLCGDTQALGGLAVSGVTELCPGQTCAFSATTCGAYPCEERQLYGGRAYTWCE